jgi:UDP-N-acetylglucosamine 1-carboxyvinyltransferase
LSRFIIDGGYPLKGNVRISGSKNAALPIMAATILMDGDTHLDNVPYLLDISSMIKMLEALGLRAEYKNDCKVRVNNYRKIRHIAPYELITAMRASFLVAGPILAKTGLAKIPFPGGCSIGARPVDIHLKGLKALGAEINIEHGFVSFKAKKLVGNKIFFDFPSVGATENVMMAATLAEGETVIENAAQEPEIVDLGRFLNKAGAKIEGLGTNVLHITGVDTLHGVNYAVIPDRIEAGTFLLAGAISKGEISLSGINLEHVQAVMSKMEDCGVRFLIESKGENEKVVHVKSGDSFKAVDISTRPFPGFPTDMQPQMMTFLTLAQGTSVVSESVFENRFLHVNELQRMGADIEIKRNSAIVRGVSSLSGAEVKITDLRAGAALVLAALAAEGTTEIYGLKHLKRGYAKFAEKLTALGAKVTSES